MPQAQIQINSVPGSNANLPIGTVVNLSNNNIGGEVTYLWAILDQPAGPTDSLSSTSSATPTFTPRKEGTYLIKLTVNALLVTQAIDQKIGAVLQIKTFTRVPAAGETVEASASEGWHGTALEATLQAFDALKADPNIVVAAAGAGGLVIGNVVQFASDLVLKTGLPGQETIVVATAALATSASITSLDLGIVVGYVAGSPPAMGGMLYVRKRGLVTNTAGSAPVLGQTVYVTDAGIIVNNTPGTHTRAVGTVINVSGSNFDAWTSFDVALASAGGGGVTLAGDVTGPSGTNTLNSSIATAVAWGAVQDFDFGLTIATTKSVIADLELNLKAHAGSDILFYSGTNNYWAMHTSGTLDLGGGDAGAQGTITIPILAGGGLFGGGGTRLIAGLVAGPKYQYGDTTYPSQMFGSSVSLRCTAGVEFLLQASGGISLFGVADPGSAAIATPTIQLAGGLSLATTFDPGPGYIAITTGFALLGWDGVQTWNVAEFNGSVDLIGDPNLILELQGTAIRAPSTTFLVGSGTINAAAQFQVDSTATGVLLPRMTTTQKNAISSPPDGLVVYDITLHRLSTWDSNASAWHNYS